MDEYPGDASVSADEIAEHTRKIRDLCYIARSGIMSEATRQAINEILKENAEIYSLVVEAWVDHHDLAVSCAAHRYLARY